MREEQEERIRLFLKGRFPGYRDAIRSDESLDSVVDSLGLFELVSFTEEAFEIKIPNETFHPNKFATISHILDTIQEFSQPRI